MGTAPKARKFWGQAKPTAPPVLAPFNYIVILFTSPKSLSTMNMCQEIIKLSSKHIHNIHQYPCLMLIHIWLFVCELVIQFISLLARIRDQNRTCPDVFRGLSSGRSGLNSISVINVMLLLLSNYVWYVVRRMPARYGHTPMTLKTKVVLLQTDCVYKALVFSEFLYLQTKPMHQPDSVLTKPRERDI